jgi:hypothetical protein
MNTGYFNYTGFWWLLAIATSLQSNTTSSLGTLMPVLSISKREMFGVTPKGISIRLSIVHFIVKITDFQQMGASNSLAISLAKIESLCFQFCRSGECARLAKIGFSRAIQGSPASTSSFPRQPRVPATPAPLRLIP